MSWVSRISLCWRMARCPASCTGTGFCMPCRRTFPRTSSPFSSCPGRARSVPGLEPLGSSLLLRRRPTRSPFGSLSRGTWERRPLRSSLTPLSLGSTPEIQTPWPCGRRSRRSTALKVSATLARAWSRVLSVASRRLPRRKLTTHRTRRGRRTNRVNLAASSGGSRPFPTPSPSSSARTESAPSGRSRTWSRCPPPTAAEGVATT
mmetsp:Transcript_17865/g.52168  ORF Transcript_17865/g.52168 Transcript_17865/m.52168 type:complete len:205 (-) Transcript_17865:742-1356(-)